MSRMLPLFALIAVLLTSLVPSPARAVGEIEHQLVRRLVVFPLKVDKGREAIAEEAWWQAREEFTKSRRFLVASKQFLVKSDVFQPRGDLEPADAVILGKLLDAHALATLQLQSQDRTLTLAVYDGGNGLSLWRKTVRLHPSLTIEDQLASLSRRLANDFIASVPYQGFTSVDAMIGQPVYSEGGGKYAKVDFGIGSDVQIGDNAQWVRIVNTTASPLFQGGGKMSVIAEGRVVKIEEGIATVEVQRASNLKDIKEFSLVRVPREAERLKTQYSLSETPRTTLTAELVAPEAKPMEAITQERRPLATTLSFVGSMAAFLLLAF